MCVSPCVHTYAHVYVHTHMHALQIHAESPNFGVRAFPRAQRRFMFPVAQTRFSRLAPRSLGLLHGHTCYSNKLHGAPPLKSDGFKGGGGGWSEFPSPPKPRSRRHRSCGIAATTYLHRGRKRTMRLFSHPSWLAAFSRPRCNDPLTDMKMHRN